jgi:hypothetical protein
MSATATPFKRHSRAQGIALIDTLRSKPSTTQELSPPPPTLSKEGVRRRSRVLNVRQTPSWVPSERGLAVSPEVSKPDSGAQQVERPAAPPRQVQTAIVPNSTWVDCIKLGTLVQGGRELLICRSRNDQRLFMLKDVGSELKNRMENIATLQHRHIALASFRVDTESTSYIASPYTRYTLEELLHTHVTMEESHIRAVALPVRVIKRSKPQQVI